MTRRGAPIVPASTTALDATSSAAQPYTSGIERVVRALARGAAVGGLLLAESSPQSGQWRLMNPGALLAPAPRTQHLLLRLRQCYHHALRLPVAEDGVRWAIKKFRGTDELARRGVGRQGLHYGPPLHVDGLSTFLVPEVTSGTENARALEDQQ